jgi:L-ribulose-5-phosphate 4-epimerase
VLGTTHADLTRHPVPLTRPLSELEVEEDYEGATGTALVEALAGRDPLELPSVLVRGHAPFCWGATPAKAVENAVTLEEVARIALLTTLLEAGAATLAEHVTRKHFERKHGAAAYYGQP